MASEFPLLFFPTPVPASKQPRTARAKPFHVPLLERQAQRITPKLQRLQDASTQKRIRLQNQAPFENPEQVLVLETLGSIKNFTNAVGKIEGLEWLTEWAEQLTEPDDDFYSIKDPQSEIPSRLFLISSNHQATLQFIALWNRYLVDPSGKFDRGFTPFRDLFQNLRDVRYWDVTDRVDNDVLSFWRDTIDSGLERVAFEIEAWHFTSVEKNEATYDEISGLVAQLGGRVVSRCGIAEIAYHGFLVELPSAAIAEILEGRYPSLLLSDRVMFFRAQAQAFSRGISDVEPLAHEGNPELPTLPPVIALLDGFPMQNHALLAGRLEIDDPDGWAENYEVKDRVHGTAMASLISHGELDAQEAPLSSKIYVRPILKPDLNDTFNQRREERSPSDVLLLDLVHQAVKRICDGDVNNPPVAPSVRVINLSVCDEKRLFNRIMSPWARLIDWLSFRYSILFIISAGNCAEPLQLNSPRYSFERLDATRQRQLAMHTTLSDSIARRVLAPAESSNALTVGALHFDCSTPNPVPNRFDPFPLGSVSPLSRLGHGYRRAIKPEILMPGGRVLFRESYPGPATQTTLEPVLQLQPPGQRVAIPPMPGGGIGGVAHTRGTSNATALASRAAARVHEVIRSLSVQEGISVPATCEAALLKALVTHGASWGDLPEVMLANRPDLRTTAEQKDFLTRWLGYGAVDIERILGCTQQRATMIGVGQLRNDGALVFSAPLPPSLAGRRVWRRLTISLAWLSPINPAHQNYRRAKLWLTPPSEPLGVDRINSANHHAVQRGTLQHEVLEGEKAVAYVDGERFECKVNCAADAGNLDETISFAICVSLEVALDSNISVYQEVKDRIRPRQQVAAG